MIKKDTSMLYSTLSFSGEKMKLFTKLFHPLILSCVITPPIWAEGGMKEAVVKIYTVYNKYDYNDYNEPWKMLRQKRRSGSGYIISGRRILTNVHVIGDQTFIQVRRMAKVKRYTGAAEMIAHDCDLAILRINDDSFFSGVKPIEIGGLAEVSDKVAVYGFPGAAMC
jgi:S1-C subfamily serine protease